MKNNKIIIGLREFSNYIMKVVKNKETLVSIFVITLILFNSFVIQSSQYILSVGIIFCITIAYTIYLIKLKKENLEKLIKSNYFLWIMLFATVMFLYGFFGPNKEVYSLKYHILSIIWIISFLIIIKHNNKKIIDVISVASSVTIVMMTLFIIAKLIGIIKLDSTSGNILTAVGNKNSTAAVYVFLLIPIFYKAMVKKDKNFILVGIIGIISTFLIGSKLSILSLVLMAIICAVGTSENKNEIKKRILKIIWICFLIGILCYIIPSLHSLIWVRFEQMIGSIVDFDSTVNSSTNIRIKFIIQAFQNAWDKPIFGHGWGSFGKMYGYSSIYQTNLYTHNNYAEILFSFGIVGLAIYYWFPITLIIKNIKNKHKETQILSWLYIIVLLFMDIGTVSCYSSIISFLGFSIVSLIIENKENIKEDYSETEGKGALEVIIRKIITIYKFIELYFRNVSIDRNIHSNISLSANIYNKGKKLEIGEIYIRANTNINTDGEGKLIIGEKSFINRNTIISCRGEITIKDNCIIGPNVCIYDHDHKFGEHGVENGYSIGNVVIGKNCWIGAGAIILKGTNIGDNSIIAAGAITKGDYPANSMIYNKKETIVKELVSKQESGLKKEEEEINE